MNKMNSATFKFPSIEEEYRGRKIVDPNLFVYEKIDGSNVSLRQYGGRIVPWSRGGPIGGANKFYFDDYRRFVYGTLIPQTGIFDLPEELILFGEFTHSGFGHIDYGRENTNQFFVLGFFNCEEKRFLIPQEVDEWTKLLDLDNVVRKTPLLCHGEIKKRDLHSLLEQSQLYTGPPEGFVVHQYNPRFPNGLKLRRCYHPDFRESTPSLKGAEKYLTVKRFIKGGQRALIDGQEITIGVILENVVQDVLKERDNSFNEEKLRQSVAQNRDLVMDRVIPLFHS